MHEHAATRLVVFPVAAVARRWAFVAKPPSLLHPPPPLPGAPSSAAAAAAPAAAQAAALASDGAFRPSAAGVSSSFGAASGSNSGGGSGVGSGSSSNVGQGGVSQKPQSTMAMVRELLAKARSASNSSERVEIVADYCAEKMHEQWVKLEEAPEKSWKRRVHNWGSALLSRLRPSEILFKNMPSKAPAVEIVYPSGLDPKLVRRRVRLLAKHGVQYHQRYLYASTAIMPFIMVLGVLPVPNLPFFWNVFRIHAHWSALRGSKRLLELTTVQSPSSQQAVADHDDDDPGKAEGRGVTKSNLEALGAEGRRGVVGHADKGKDVTAVARVVSSIPRLSLVESRELARLIAPANAHSRQMEAPAKEAGEAMPPDGAKETQQEGAHSNHKPVEVMDDLQLAQVCKEFALDTQLVTKWRDAK